ncbi:uncharacterized protein LOC132704632 isoform X2 [Cylas formicarius]|nr:uncharacterized protein LOC132704632 isoform X2 [Cylas formicarius]
MNNTKHFEASGTFLPVLENLYGLCNSCEFKQQVDSAEELSQLKKLNLSNEEAKLCSDFKRLSKEEFDYKYRNVNSDILSTKLKIVGANLKMLIGENSCFNDQPVNGNTSEKVIASHPMEKISELERDLMESIKNFSHTKVRKKIRNLSNKIKHLERVPDDKNSTSKKGSDSLWDVKETIPTETTIELIKREKMYSCKPENLYTIKDGVIVKLTKPQVTPRLEVGGKLSVNKIKEIPKFKDWTPGDPSINLYLKNLPKNISECDIQPLLKNFPEDCFSVRIMDGKMKGQAFVKFQSIEQASEAMDVLNGVIIGNRPIICQFGKKKILNRC